MATTAGPPPYAEEWLEFEKAAGGRLVLRGTVLEMRQQFTELCAAMANMVPAIPGVDTRNETIPAGVPVRIYTPTDAPAGPLPLCLFFHSGGFCFGSIDTEDHLARSIAVNVPCVVVSPEYRLAPENPFPAGTNDCQAAYLWAVENAKSLGADPEKRFVCGGSAGGGLSLQVGLLNVDEPAVRPKAIFAQCPGTISDEGMPLLDEKYQKLGEGLDYSDSAMIDEDLVKICTYSLTTDQTNPMVAVALHPKLGNLPHTYLTTSNKDPLEKHSTILHAIMQDSGNNNVTLKRYDGYPHFHHTVLPLKAAQQFLNDLYNDIRREAAKA